MKGVKLLFAIALLAFGVYVFFWGSADTADVAFRAHDAIGGHETELSFGLIGIVLLLGAMGLHVHPAIYDGDEDQDDAIDEN